MGTVALAMTTYVPANGAPFADLTWHAPPSCESDELLARCQTKFIPPRFTSRWWLRLDELQLRRTYPTRPFLWAVYFLCVGGEVVLCVWCVRVVP